MVIEGYTLGDALGEGAFAVTRIGFNNLKPNQPVAVKTVLRNHPRFNLEDLQAEIAIMKRIDHPRCVNLIEVCEDAEAIHLVEELGAGGELFDRIIELGSFSEKDACHLIHQVIDGVTYLHSQGCIHRDLKPENLLMVGRDPNTDEYMQIKICDFGLSAMRTVATSEQEFNENLQKFNGTEEYLAPEVFITAARAASLNKNGEHYTGKIDVWAIGVIYYIMLSGRFPFMRDEDDPFAMTKRICEGKYDMGCLAAISDDSKELITKCLLVDQDERPSAFDLMDFAIFKNDRLPTDDLFSLSSMASLQDYKSWRRRRSSLDAVKAMARIKVQEKHTRKQKNGTGVVVVSKADKEAADLFDTIHSSSNANPKGIELFEIVLYLQERMQHLFLKRDKTSGLLVFCPERAKTFCSLLTDKVDLDHDGYISKEEFITGYSIWQVHVKKAEMLQMRERQASFIYKH